MKKITILICALCLSACGGKATSTSNEGAMVVGGSTSIQPIMEQLVEAYNQKDDTNLTVQGGGSSVGVKGTIDDTFQIGMVSRQLKEEETSSLDDTIIALDGIVLVVNKENKVNDLTLDQAKKIFTGEITNWKEVGGDDLEIAVISREEGSGTRDGFESILGFTSTELVRHAEVQNATGAIISNIRGNTHAIGYISMGSMSNDVKALNIEGVKASEETVNDQTYKLQRPFLLVVTKDSKLADNFYNFIFSEAGAKIIRNNHYVPVKQK